MVLANVTHASYILQLLRVDRGHLWKSPDDWDGSLLLSRCLKHQSSSLKKKNLEALCKCTAKKLNSEREDLVDQEIAQMVATIQGNLTKICVKSKKTKRTLFRYFSLWNFNLYT